MEHNQWAQMLRRIASPEALEKLVDRKSRELEGSELLAFMRAAEYRHAEMMQ